MALVKKTAADMADAPRKTHRTGWYQAAFTKVEPKTSKATQHMLNYGVRLLAEENNPDSVVGSPVFGLLMYPAWEDDDAFRQSIADKKGVDGEELEAEVAKRIEMAENGAASFALAVFGYDEFPATPRKDKESGEYLLPDGTVVSSAAERNEMFKARKAAAYNAAIDVAIGERDITRYTVYVKVDTETYQGNEKNVIKTLRASLPEGETLLFP